MLDLNDDGTAVRSLNREADADVVITANRASIPVVPHGAPCPDGAGLRRGGIRGRIVLTVRKGRSYETIKIDQLGGA